MVTVIGNVMVLKRKCLLYVLAVSAIVMFGTALYMQSKQNDEKSNNIMREEFLNDIPMPSKHSNDPSVEISIKNESDGLPLPNRNVHIFYYPWYGNPEHDSGYYYHWAHYILEHWDKRQAGKWPKGRLKPPDNIGSNFYPLLGCYSSRDDKIIRQHMHWIRSCGIGVIVISWYPPGMTDDQGAPWDDLTTNILDAAYQYKLKVAFHIEPYKGRDASNLRSYIAYIMKSYSNHPAFYFHTKSGLTKPMFYIYDSYLIENEQWQTLLKPSGKISIRNTKLDAFYIGLMVKETDKTSLLKSGFDGLYTYFGIDGFTFGSRWKNWPNIRAFSRKNRLIFIPSVAPGYVDTRVRPWNSQNHKDRNTGTYFESSFFAAINSGAEFVSITSFNEWHEGTQIEPAIAKEVDKFKYEDYGDKGPFYYLNLTRKWVETFSKQRL